MMELPSFRWPALAVLLLGACSLGSSNTYPRTAPVRALNDLPPALAPADSLPPETARTSATCRGRLTDPQDGAVFVLRSSQGGQVGDYEGPPGRYGLWPDEYLRVECRSLRPLGGVPRPR